jgi:hypothetical protein
LQFPKNDFIHRQSALDIKSIGMRRYVTSDGHYIQLNPEHHWHLFYACIFHAKRAINKRARASARARSVLI